MSYARSTSPTDVLREQGIISQVYAWMTAGLLVTGAIALAVAGSESLTRMIFGNPLVLIGLFIAEIALVIGLSAKINSMPTALATAMFLAYSAVNGLTLSAVFIVYTKASIASTFFITGGTFGAMSLYGYTTKRDLTSMGNLLFMALIGLILASVVNIFLHSSFIYWLTTYAGILIFVGLTAYDTQKIKGWAAKAQSEDDMHRVAILGALNLYLDFINLFLYLLRIFGKRN